MEPSEFTNSTGDVARRLGVTHDTIADWADKGHLPCWRTPGGHRRFRPADVDRFIADRATPGPGPDGAA